MSARSHITFPGQHKTKSSSAVHIKKRKVGGFAPLAILPFLPLITAAAAPVLSAIGNKIGKKISGRGLLRAGSTRKTGGMAPATKKKSQPSIDENVNEKIINKKTTLNNEYNKNLKNIISILGDGITNGEQLFNISKKLFGDRFLGIYGDKQKKPRLNLDECIIVNRKDNEHWICKANVNNTVYTYDSFNRKSYLGGFKSGDYDGRPDQKLYEENCGQRCIAWLVTIFSQ
jgi:hypothetical protein